MTPFFLSADMLRTQKDILSLLKREDDSAVLDSHDNIITTPATMRLKNTIKNLHG